MYNYEISKIANKIIKIPAMVKELVSFAVSKLSYFPWVLKVSFLKTGFLTH